MNILNIKITGMTCDQCAQHIQEGLNALKGVTASVSYPDALATVKTQGEVENAQLLKAIESKGYQAKWLNEDGVTSTDSYDNKLHVAIVGTGSGAFAAAIKAAEEGATVTMIEGADIIGGTCVNVGCVPSKVMIRAAHIAHIQGHHEYRGLLHNKPKINRQVMVAQQQELVEHLRHAKYESILDANEHITLLRGMARFKSSTTLVVTSADGSEIEISADRIFLAVGAKPAIPNSRGLHDTPYWTSTEALIAEEIPQHLVVLGGSVVALELAQAFRHLGAEVTILARSTLLSKEDPAIGDSLKEIFENEGIRILLHTVPKSVAYEGKEFILSTHNENIHCDQLLVATGRSPNTASLALDEIGINVDQRGGIIVDDHMRTSIEHIYAAGDCTNQPQYVYVAAAGGTRAAINMTGGDASINFSSMPAVVFTNPQVATVGFTEQQANDLGLDVESRILDLENVPRSLANIDTRGFIKLVASKNGGRIIGCQVLAAEGGEIIQTAALAIHNCMTIQQLADQLFPYLTMVEGLKLCAQTFTKDVTQLSCCAG